MEFTGFISKVSRGQIRNPGDDGGRFEGEDGRTGRQHSSSR